MFCSIETKFPPNREATVPTKEQSFTWLELTTFTLEEYSVGAAVVTQAANQIADTTTSNDTITFIFFSSCSFALAEILADHSPGYNPGHSHKETDF
jgi:hypothetical protein